MIERDLLYDFTVDRLGGIPSPPDRRKLPDRRKEGRLPSASYSLIPSLECTRSFKTDTNRFKLKPYE